VRRRERPFRHTYGAVKGAFTALSAANAPFTTWRM
jgi:hypothetical protein